MEEQRITLTRSRARTVINAVQGESNARKLIFSVLNDSGVQIDLDSSNKAYFYVGKYAQIPGTIDVTQNTVSVILPLQATSVAGDQTCVLQIYDDDADLWRGDMILRVSRNPAAEVMTDPEYLPITEMLKKTTEIDRLLDKAESTAESAQSVLSAYVGDMKEESKVTVGTESGEDTLYGNPVAYDLSGDLLWLDTKTNRAAGTKISADDGVTWTALPLEAENTENQGTYQMCIGGEKILVLGKDYIVWIKNGSVEGKYTNPLKVNISPLFFHARYVQERYWTFRNSPGSGVTSPAYFTGSGNSFVTVSLPESGMEAQDIDYDDKTGLHWMVGGYSAYDSARANNAWLASSADRINWIVKLRWTNGGYRKHLISVKDGIACVFFNVSDSTGYLYRVDLTAATLAKEQVALAEGDTFNGTASSGYCMMASGKNGMVFSKDGRSWTKAAFSEGGDIPALCTSFGRKAAASKGKLVYVYRADLAGEKIVGELEAAKEEYDQLTEEFADYAGRKIVYTTTIPTAGSSSEYEDGTLICVYT